MKPSLRHSRASGNPENALKVLTMHRSKLTFAVAAVLAAQPLGIRAQSDSESESPGIQLEIAPPRIESAAPYIEEVIVLGEFIPDEKRDTSEIANVLTGDDMALLGDGDVAASLERVAGLSLVGGKYVYVRGLGERYSATLLNGSLISSPVPFQKTVPLDLVPNSLVRDLLVQKSYSPQYPGDFSGGLVLVRTKTVPDENYLSLSLGSGGNGASTGGKGLSYKGGARDDSGWDDGTRQMPVNIAPLSSAEFETGAAAAELNAAYGYSFYNNWEAREQELHPDAAAELEFGYRHEFDSGAALGIAAAGKYSNEWRKEDTAVRRYEFSGALSGGAGAGGGADADADGSALSSAGGGTQTVDFAERATMQSIGLSGFLNLGLELGHDHQLSSTSLILRQTNDTLERRAGRSSEDDVSGGTPVESYFLQWVENEIRSQQFSGEHYLPAIAADAALRWRYVRGAAQRDAPDTRSYSYADNAAGMRAIVVPGRQAAGDLRDVFSAPDRVYNKQDDAIQDFGFDLEIPFLAGGADLALKAGAAAYEREREVERRAFRFDLSFRAPPAAALQTPAQLFALDNWQSGYLTVRDFSGGSADASGIFPFASSREQVTAAYAAIDMQLTSRLRVQGGARREEAELEADAWGGNTAPGAGNAVRQRYEDWLPAASVTFEIIPDMQIRFSYSETVNRPSLLEITGSTLRHPDNGFYYRGNVFLQQAELSNADARWEWYFGGDEFMSFGLFHKEFSNPIELGKVQAQGDIFTWFNAESAELRGAEYELRKALWFGEWFGLSEAWNDFTLTLNLSRIDSEVILLGADETAAAAPLTGGRQLSPLFVNERPLAGQSDWLGNLALSYESAYLGIQAALAYNYTGERLALVGDRSAPNIYEEARGQLDLSIKYAFDLPGSEWEISLKARNLLDEESALTQGPLPYESHRPGATWSLSLSARF